MITILLGIASSILTEVITWVGKKLTGTLLEGKAAELVAVTLALVAGMYSAIVQFAQSTDTTISFVQIGQYALMAFGASQIWFKTIARFLNIKTE